MRLVLLSRSCFSLSSSFSVLGLKPSSPLQQVKKKYFQLAKKCHPDLNKSDKNAHNKFTEISKAYRYILDNHNPEQTRNQSTAQTASPQDQRTTAEPHFRNQKRQQTRAEQQDYEQFRDYDPFFKQGKKFRKPKVGEDIYINLTITLTESVLGIHKPLTYSRYEPCSSCATKQFAGCFSCGGKGEIYDRRIREKVRCEFCSGKGFKNDCQECMGASYVVNEVTDQIYVEKGTKDKTILRVDKKGHSGYKADNGDLYVTIFVEESQKFRIDGNNVYSQQYLDYFTAACGGPAQIETVFGIREIDIPAGTQSGSEIRIFDAGLKSYFSKRRGDHIVKIRIKIPEKVNAQQRKLFEELQ